jgi:hypothetical protein
MGRPGGFDDQLAQQFSLPVEEAITNPRGCGQDHLGARQVADDMGQGPLLVSVLTLVLHGQH